MIHRGEQLSTACRMIVVIAGILIGQFYLYGPALIGRQLLLPLDLLVGLYVPRAAGTTAPKSRDLTQIDQVIKYELDRRFTAEEIRAGRWPLWNPCGFAGAPGGGVQWSPFQAWYVLWPDPRILAWIQLLSALVAGFGAYRACRSMLEVEFWPAAIAGWCYPLTGFFVLWQGHSLPHSAAFFPWLLWATDDAVKNPGGSGGPWVAVFTSAAIGCGALDIAGQSLIVCGLYVLMRWAEMLWQRKWWTSLPTIAAPVFGWGLGFLLTSVILLPTMEYLPTGARYQDRVVGIEERPPVGLDVLPFVIAPELQGRPRPDSIYVGYQDVVPESTAAGYAGLIAACLLAPLALYRRSDRLQVAFWCFCGLLGLSWSLNLPGFVQLLRLPLLNSLSHNRFVFVTGWSILALSAIGLDGLWRGLPERRIWFWIPTVGTALLGLYLLSGSATYPEQLAVMLEQALREDPKFSAVSNLEDVRSIKAGFFHVYLAAGITSCAACLGWGLIASRRVNSRVMFGVCSFALVVELLRFAGAWPLMADPELYYPPVAALEQLASAPPGRSIGIRCLPPKLGELYKLQDLRGYDAVDPSGIVDLLGLVQDERFESPRYARTQYFVPRGLLDSDKQPHLPGVLNMLNLRYLIFRGKPLPKFKSLIVADDYWVWENPDALPRVYVPSKIERSGPRRELLDKLARPDFDALQLSFVDGEKEYSHCSGSAHIVREDPQEIVIEAEMNTAGVVVLADAWYSGWQAELNGQTIPIQHANHALRGVEFPEGHSTLVMKYRPKSFTQGMQISIAALLVCFAWFAIAAVQTHRRTARRDDKDSTGWGRLQGGEPLHPYLPRQSLR